MPFPEIEPYGPATDNALTTLGTEPVEETPLPAGLTAWERPDTLRGWFIAWNAVSSAT